MKLIPKDPNEFSSGAYWRKFFEEVNCPFEWYGDVEDYAFRIYHALKLDAKILQVGCGNSKLETDMYSHGYRNIHSIDINSKVIAEKQAAAMPGLTYSVADITNFDCEDNVYDGIIDKGTYDALSPTDDSKFHGVVDAMFKHCLRVLKPNGKYFIVTLAQNHNLYWLDAIFNHRRDLNFVVHRVDIPDATNTNGVLPAVLFEITKLNKPFPAGIPISLYYAEEPNKKPVRMETDAIVAELGRRRHMYMFFSMCKKPLKAPSFIDINGPEGNLRWRFWVVDGPTDTIHTLAFIVVSPDAKLLKDFYKVDQETFEGFRKSVATDRVVLAEQQHGVSYGNHDDISKELEAISPHFMTKDCCPGSSVSYMSADNGDKCILFTGESPEAGEFEVHNAFLDQTTTLRRLIFKNTPHVIQSDCVVKKRDENDDEYKIVDCLNINSPYQVAMVAGLVFRYGSVEALISSSINVAIIGVGGGTLPTFMYNVFKNFKFTCVELIPEFYKVAEQYFAYPYKQERVTSLVANGLDWLKDETVPKFDVLYIDVGIDSDDEFVSYPPPEFNTTQMLQKYKERIHERGLVIVNIFINDKDKYYNLLAKFQAVFDHTIIGEFGSNHILVASMYSFAQRKQYTSRIIGTLPPEQRILASKISDFVPLQIPKSYRIPKLTAVEKQKEKKEKAKERQKKNTSRDLLKKEVAKRQKSKDEHSEEEDLAKGISEDCKISEATGSIPKVSYASIAKSLTNHPAPPTALKTDNEKISDSTKQADASKNVVTKDVPTKKKH